MKNKTDIKNKKIVIVGLSKSGFSSACLAKKEKADVFVTEIAKNRQTSEKAAVLRKKGISVELGEHSVSFLKGADIILTSPGVKHEAFPLVWAKKNKVPVISEIEFASWFCSAPVIAITGSNGKTTVTTLIGKILKDAGKHPIVCGNIGNPFCGEIGRSKLAENMVIEVSSFQLQNIRCFHPRISIILNISQNHFDHHHSMAEFVRAKANILVNQRPQDYAILNFDDRRVRRLSLRTKAKVLFFSTMKNPVLRGFKGCYGACWLEGENVVGRWNKRKIRLFSCRDLKIPGLHNVANVMAAVLAAKASGVASGAFIKSIRKFSGVEHRCELVRKINGVTFVNDSKSTTVDATEKALAMFKDGSVILICGGRDKGSDFSVIKKLVDRKVCLLVVIGESKDLISSALGKGIKVFPARTLKEAVRFAYRKANADSIILLSPMCASFDMFDNYEHRGEVFKAVVREL